MGKKIHWVKLIKWFYDIIAFFCRQLDIYVKITKIEYIITKLYDPNYVTLISHVIKNWKNYQWTIQYFWKLTDLEKSKLWNYIFLWPQIFFSSPIISHKNLWFHKIQKNDNIYNWIIIYISVGWKKY